MSETLLKVDSWLGDSGIKRLAVTGLAQLTNELTLVIPRHVHNLKEDQERRERFRKVARHCHLSNKVEVVGDNPVNIEAEQMAILWEDVQLKEVD